MRDVKASGEPIYPDVAASIGVSPEDPQTPPSVYETWALQHKRTQHIEWWSDNWEATASYTLNGLPIDGLITYVTITSKDVTNDSSEQLDRTPPGRTVLTWERTCHGGITPTVLSSRYSTWHQVHSQLVYVNTRRSIYLR